jgi:hypothetical protein
MWPSCVYASPPPLKNVYAYQQIGMHVPSLLLSYLCMKKFSAPVLEILQLQYPITKGEPFSINCIVFDFDETFLRDLCVHVVCYLPVFLRVSHYPGPLPQNTAYDGLSFRPCSV